MHFGILSFHPLLREPQVIEWLLNPLLLPPFTTHPHNYSKVLRSRIPFSGNLIFPKIIQKKQRPERPLPSPGSVPPFVTIILWLKFRPHTYYLFPFIIVKLNWSKSIRKKRKGPQGTTKSHTFFDTVYPVYMFKMNVFLTI